MKLDAETLTQIAAVIAALTGLVTAIGIAWNNRVTKQTHTLVNSQHDHAIAYQETLIAHLQAAGAEVPPDPNVVAARDRIASKEALP